MHQIALGAVAMALQHHKSECDITLGAPYLNRNIEDDQSIVGLFLEPLPIRIHFDPATSEDKSLVQTIQSSSRAALSHAVPWHQLLSHLSITPELHFPNHPIFDVMVTFHDKNATPIFSLEDTQPVYTWTQGAKFNLMAEFMVDNDGNISLRLEYSEECFSEEDILILEKCIVTALEGVLAGEGWEEGIRRIRNLKT